MVARGWIPTTKCVCFAPMASFKNIWAISHWWNMNIKLLFKNQGFWQHLAAAKFLPILLDEAWVLCLPQGSSSPFINYTFTSSSWLPFHASCSVRLGLGHSSVLQLLQPLTITHSPGLSKCTRSLPWPPPTPVRIRRSTVWHPSTESSQVILSVFCGSLHYSTHQSPKTVIFCLQVCTLPQTFRS